MMKPSPLVWQLCAKRASSTNWIAFTMWMKLACFIGCCPGDRTLPRVRTTRRQEASRHEDQGPSHGLHLHQRLRNFENASGFHRHCREPQVSWRKKRLLPNDTVYLQQKRAWSDTLTFGTWFKSSLRFARKKTSKPALLLMDSHSNPASLKDSQGQV